LQYIKAKLGRKSYFIII